MKFIDNLSSKYFRKLLLSNIKESYHGVHLCDITSDNSKENMFISTTKKALDLISDIDSKQFSRIKKGIQYIVNAPGISGGNYISSTKACNVDFTKYKFKDNYEWYFYSYAGTLVHEATHGFLHSQGIKTTRKNRIKVERICHSEKNRFLKKINTPLSNQLITEFNEKKLEFYLAW